MKAEITLPVFLVLGMTVLCSPGRGEDPARECDSFRLSLTSIAAERSPASQSVCSNLKVMHLQDVLKPAPVEPLVDPVDDMIRQAIADKDASLNQRQLWIRVLPVDETYCLDPDRRGTELDISFLLDDLLADGSSVSPSTDSGQNENREVTKIQAIGAYLLDFGPMDLGPAQLIEGIDRLRQGRYDGRAIFKLNNDSSGSAWEILSLEIRETELQSGSRLSPRRWECTKGEGNDLKHGRDLINSDPIRAMGHGAPKLQIALLDTGVEPNALGNGVGIRRRDCLQTGGCRGANPGDSHPRRHGTKSAGILSGRRGAPFRGVTDLPVLSLKIGDVQLDPGATERALDHLLCQKGSKGCQPTNPPLGVVLAQVQANGKEAGVVSALADDAFDRGLVVVAPVGNTGLGKRLLSPGNAHKVLSVGAAPILAPDNLLGGYGPTRDGRTKPDLLAPTGTEVPIDSSKHCDLHEQTSGAAPYVGGAVALIQNLVLKTFQVDEARKPGLIYALALSAGDQPYDPLKTRRRGAGFLKLPSRGTWFFGRTEIAEDESLLLPIEGVEEGDTVDAAIWWPEEVRQDHSDLDLQIRNSCGGPQGVRGEGSGSVLERAQTIAEVDNCPGDPWYLEISAYSVSDRCLMKNKNGRQEVYWAVLVH